MSILGVCTLLALPILPLPTITLTLVIYRVLADGALCLVSIVFAVAVVIKGLVGRDEQSYRRSVGGFIPLDIVAIGVFDIFKSFTGIV